VKDWITISEGEYSVNEACLITRNHHAVVMENVTINVFYGRKAIKRMEGHSLVQNILMVELLEFGEELDILLNFEDGVHFLMENPEIHAGKVFAANVKSTIRFTPKGPWKQLDNTEYREIQSKLVFVKS